MKMVSVEIEGICPILFNNFFDAKSLSKQGSKKKTQTEYDDEVQYKVYRKTKTGPMGIPANNIKKSILEAVTSAGLKVGRRSAIEYFRATMFLDTDFVSLGKKKPDGIHQCAGRRPPRTGGAVLISRPYLDTGWKAAFKLHISDDRLSLEMVEIALIEAGLIKGLCDHRPEYGRFKVTKFEACK